MISVADILTPDRISIDVEASSRKRVLENLSSLLAAADKTLSERLVFDSLFARERLGSTGLGSGVAIPHARVPHLASALGAFVRVSGGVEFDAPDGDPVDLIFGLAVPEESTDEHLHILSQLAELFSSGSLRDRLRRTESELEVCELLSNGASTAARE